MGELDGKVALVTGGSRGMGAAIARALGGRGASIAITYRKEREAAAAVTRELQAQGVSAFAVQADHAGHHSTTRAIDAIIEHFAAIDILVNNAGIFPYATVEQTTPEQIEAALAIHVRTPFIAVQKALTVMGPGGRIISIGSSLAVSVTGPGASLYAASKAALVGMTKALARELGPRGITANLVNPGSIDTEMNPADGPQANGERALIPLARYGRVEEIADTVSFLASPAAAYINGAIVAVDGGVTA